MRCHPVPGRLTLGLFNSYDPRRFHEAHRRALARAAPLAFAFDANLATFGFPYDEGRRRETKRADAPDLRTPKEIATFVADSTTIGEGGEYFLQLAEAGRFAAHPFPKGGFPPQLGEVVLTTRKPEAGKAATPEGVRKMMDRSGVLLVFGLGPHGVPKDVPGMCARHLDVTGRGVSLETCTAMGAVMGAVAPGATIP